MLENLETYRESYSPLAEQETENSNHQRKAKSLFSRSLTENYGKGIAFFSSCKNKICSTVKKIGDDVTKVISKRPVKNLEQVPKNPYSPETMSYEENLLWNKILRKSFDISDYQEKAEKSNYFDYLERLAISDSEERKRLEPLIANKISNKNFEKTKKNLKIDISEIKESALDLCPTERQLYIVQSDDEESNEDSNMNTSIPTIEIDKNVERPKSYDLKNNKKIETSDQEVKKIIEKKETEPEKNPNLTNEKKVQISINNIGDQKTREQEVNEINLKMDKKVDRSTQIDINPNLEHIEKEENDSFETVKKNDKSIQSIENKNPVKITDMAAMETGNNAILKANTKIETFIQNTEINQNVENLEKREIEIEINENLKRDNNLEIFIQKKENKVDPDKEEIEKIETLKKDNKIEEYLSFPQSLVGDLNIAPAENEMKESEFQFCISEPKQSIVNFNHYLDQKFPFDFSQNNRVEIIKQGKNPNQKKKNKNRFLAWCCS